MGWREKSNSLNNRKPSSQLTLMNRRVQHYNEKNRVMAKIIVKNQTIKTLSKNGVF